MIGFCFAIFVDEAAAAAANVTACGDDDVDEAFVELPYLVRSKRLPFINEIK